jgi:hypothetical protein
MLTPLSIFSLDQGPKWREPCDDSALEAPKALGPAFGRRLEALRTVAFRLATFVLRPVLSVSRMNRG